MCFHSNQVCLDNYVTKHNRNNNHNNFMPIDTEEIKNKISNNLKKNHLVMSRQNFDGGNHPDVTYSFSLKVNQNGLKSFKVLEDH